MTQAVVGIDPGPEKSALVVIGKSAINWAWLPNCEVVEYLRNAIMDVVAIEAFQYFGQHVGKSSFDTVLWSGRFIERALEAAPTVLLIPRKTIVTSLCGSARAGDSLVRAALLKRYPGVKTTGHCWSALAVADFAARLNAVGRKRFEVEGKGARAKAKML